MCHGFQLNICKTYQWLSLSELYRTLLLVLERDIIPLVIGFCVLGIAALQAIQAADITQT